MNRLTEKNTKFADVLETMDFSKVEQLYNKLQQLEDLEEELGITLIRLFKALKNGFYYKNFVAHRIDFSKDCKSSVVIDTDGILLGNKGKMLFKDYGKTWALTREELEEKSNETTHT